MELFPTSASPDQISVLVSNETRILTRIDPGPLRPYVFGALLTCLKLLRHGRITRKAGMTYLTQ
jgi:hypothetical protein